jgi:hypothetical protein
MKQEMDENTMYATGWRTALKTLGVVFATCWGLSSVRELYEVHIKVEIARMETSPEGIRHAELVRDRAMYESMNRSSKP